MNTETEITLVQAEMRDLDEALALCRETAAKTPSSHWGEEYPNREILYRDISIHSLYKVLREGKIVSIMQIRPWADFIAGDEAGDIDTWNPAITKPCALGRFCVAPALQHQGMGRRVLNAALEKAKAMGFDGAFFHVITENPIALALYDSMGFHNAGSVHEYGSDFYCYEMKF